MRTSGGPKDLEPSCSRPKRVPDVDSSCRRLKLRSPCDLCDTFTDVPYTLTGVSDTLAEVSDTLTDVPDTLTGVSDTLADVSDTLTGVSDTLALLPPVFPRSRRL